MFSKLLHLVSNCCIWFVQLISTKSCKKLIMNNLDLGIHIDTVFSPLAERMERAKGRVQKESKSMCQTFTRDALNPKDVWDSWTITSLGLSVVEPAMCLVSESCQVWLHLDNLLKVLSFCRISVEHWVRLFFKEIVNQYNLRHLMFNGLDFFHAFLYYLLIYSEGYHLCPFPTV